MQQNATLPETKAGVQPYKFSAFDNYITFCAIGGMRVTDTGQIETITLDQFCEDNGVNRATVFRWKKNTPDFAMRVRARRDEVIPLARETAALNRLFLLGMSSLPTRIGKDGKPTGALHHDQRAAVDALKTYLGHHSELRVPTQRAEVDIKYSVSDLLKAASDDGIIEGEIVDAPAAHATTNGEDTGTLPLPS